jgi:DNA polymerase IV
MHIDMNSYFASVEQQANPFLRGKAVGVTGKQESRAVVAAASIEAKKRGVKTAMSNFEARKIAPDLIMVSGDSSKYSHITSTFLDIFHEFTDLVEQFSVDEAFLDVTEQTEDYMGATIIAQMIKARLSEECGSRITCSVGIAPNKLLAKLASELEKPDGLIVVKPKDIPRLLELVELRDFCGIGQRVEARLNMLGIYTVEQLQGFPVHLLVKEFKSLGFWLHDAAHGRDNSVLSPLGKKGLEQPKSMGHSYTFPKDLWDPLEMRQGLLGLADKVGWRLRRDGFVSRQVSTYVRYGDFTGAGKVKRFHEATNNGLQLLRIAWSLIEQVRDPNKPVRLLGLSAGRLSHGKEQVPLFPKEQKIQTVTSALDKIQAKYGSKGWTRACLLGVEFKERSSGFHFDDWS